MPSIRIDMETDDLHLTAYGNIYHVPFDDHAAAVRTNVIVAKLQDWQRDMVPGGPYAYSYQLRNGAGDYTLHFYLGASKVPFASTPKQSGRDQDGNVFLFKVPAAPGGGNEV